MVWPVISRSYSNVVTSKSDVDNQYTNLDLNPELYESYTIEAHIGQGKFSDVYRGYKKGNMDLKYVVKMLRPINRKKINREVFILRQLNHINIIKLHAVLKSDDFDSYGLVFTYMNFCDIRQEFSKMSVVGIKSYSKQLLEGLKFCHSKGIMHRDIKPGNLIIDQKKRILKIIDWGLSEFYVSNTEYSTRVGTRNYKSPEILSGYPFYSYSIDMWGFGCILSEMLFQIYPFFKGEDNDGVLKHIGNRLGKIDLMRYFIKYDIYDEDDLFLRISREERIELSKYLHDYSPEFLNGVDLLEKVFVYDHIERWTVDECLSHKFYVPKALND